LGKKRFKPFTVENVTIEKAVAEGYGLTRLDGEVVFVEEAAPKDVVDIHVYRKRRKNKYARIEKIIEPSPERVQPQCSHFSSCGGCKWQHLSYDGQLKFKQQQILDQFVRIGKFESPHLLPIKGCERIFEYRNKLEYSFSNNRWILREELDGGEVAERNALGYHIAGRYDKILHIDSCHLMDNLQNDIRNFIYQYALDNGIDFFDIKEGLGTLRNLTFKCNKNNEWMVLLVTTDQQPEKIAQLLEELTDRFDSIQSLYHAINLKSNDSIYDLDFQKIYGSDTISESLLGLSFVIRPKSFFQTNPYQTEVLYKSAMDFISVEKDAVLYDLYSGTGTIGLSMAAKVKKVIGVESVPDAVRDAEQNAERNGIDNAHFVCGDMKNVFNDDFYREHGNPDVIITDPPRAGMHPGVVKQLLEIQAPKLVYISCNPATQARDAEMLKEKYDLEALQPVDMFPMTHHVENIAVFRLR
jgi:23S rRNA (uracil1939-C5)-methyltransferase